MQLIFDDKTNLFYFNCTYYEKDIPKGAGFKWNPSIKKWYTSNPEVALELIPYGDKNVLQKIDQLKKRTLNAIEESKATKCDINIPCPEGLAYFPFQKAGVSYMINRKDILNADEMGCISGETKIIVNRAGGARQYYLKDLYKTFNNLEVNKRCRWDMNIPTYTRSLSNNKQEFRLNRIRKVLYKGYKKVWNLKTEMHEIKATQDHIFFTKYGEKELGSIKLGEFIYVNGLEVCPICGTDKNIIKYKYSKFKGHCKECMYKHKRNNFNKNKKGEKLTKDGLMITRSLTYHPYNRSDGIPKHRLVVEANVNGYTYNKWLDIIKYNKFELDCIFLQPDQHIHHKNGNKLDNRLHNLEIHTPSSYQSLHGNYRNLKRFFIPKLEKVLSIEYCGLEEVYDIQMDSPNHNFIANGIVVHNCGKTIQSIGLINALPSIKKVLIVCPATMKLVWKSELEKWLVNKDLKISVWDSKNYEDGDIIIINYDILTKYPILNEIPFSLVIGDEIHYCKSNKAKRSKAFYKIANRAIRRLYLTGTPILNRPAELFYILKSLNFPLNWYEFMTRYAGAYKNSMGYWDIKGATNLDELQEKLRGHLMVRRLKKDVLTELPDKIRQVIELDDDKLKEVVSKEEEYLKEKQSIIKQIKEKIKESKLNKDEDSYKKAVKELKEFNFSAFTDLSRLRHLTALKKVPYAIEHIKNLLESQNKIVVFAHHRDVLDKIYKEFKNYSVLLTGDNSPEEKKYMVDHFQSDPNCRLFICSIKAGGLGLTLTASSIAIFVELDWTPAIVSQAEDRIHRISQKNSVLIQHLVINGSIDSKIAKMCIEKQEVITEALDKRIDISDIEDF